MDLGFDVGIAELAGAFLDDLEPPPESRHFQLSVLVETVGGVAGRDGNGIRGPYRVGWRGVIPLPMSGLSPVKLQVIRDLDDVGRHSSLSFAGAVSGISLRRHRFTVRLNALAR